jgi:hypothetical protein
VVVAALILALTTTSGRLFLASTEDAAIAQEFKRIGGVPTLAMVVFGADRSGMTAVEAEVQSVVRDQAPELGPPVRSMLGRPWTPWPAPGPPKCGSPPGTAPAPTSSCWTEPPPTVSGSPTPPHDRSAFAPARPSDWAAAVFDAMAALAAGGSCCLVATHSEEFLPRVDRVLTISDGQLPAYAGGGASGGR